MRATNLSISLILIVLALSSQHTPTVAAKRSKSTLASKSRKSTKSTKYIKPAKSPKSLTKKAKKGTTALPTKTSKSKKSTSKKAATVVAVAVAKKSRKKSKSTIYSEAEEAIETEEPFEPEEAVGTQEPGPRLSEPAMRACFPACAQVTKADGTTVRMDELRLGDAIAVGGGKVSEVFAFTHRDSSVRAVFVRATSEGSGVLVASEGHYVYANGALVAMKDVRVGDFLVREGGEKERVVAVAREEGDGLYNPQTVHGDVVVGGFVVSTYTTAVEPALAHGLLAPLRGLYAWLGYGVLVEDFGEGGVSFPVSVDA